MLDKRLKLGGLQVGGPRTSQNVARFRVANNVYQTRDEYMIPRFHGAEYTPPADLAAVEKVMSLARYRDKLFTMAATNSGTYRFFDSNGDLIPARSIGTNSNIDLEQFPSGPQFVEKLGNLYIGTPYNYLFKYDGTQLYSAGVPLPFFSCAERADAGATYVRVIQHHLDFQGNNVYSGYVQFRATPNGSGNIVLRVDKNTTDIVGQGLFGVEPTSRPTWERFDGLYDEWYFRASASSVNAGLNQVTVTTGGNHDVAVGVYLIVSPQLQPPAVTNLAFDTLGIALRVKSFDATTVTLDLLDAKYLDTNREWQVANIPPTALLLNSLPEGVNYWLSVWTSTSATAAYVYRGVCPALYNSTTSQTFTIDVTPNNSPELGSENLFFVVAPILGDFYDVTSSKGVLPRLTQQASPNSCFSTYGDLMLMSYLNEIYFSDTSLGGSFEMINGFSFIVVGEGDDGNVQTVCGTADFLFVSRQFKNYYVVGTLPTANYRVSEISETSLGAYSNECSIAVNDKVIFLNKQGVWALYTGGRCEEVSFNIRGLFNNFSNTTAFDEEAFFDLDSFPTYSSYYDLISPIVFDKWIRTRLDVNRNLLAFVIKGDGQGQILILNLNNGEFYTWSGMLEAYPFTGTPDLADLTFIDGDYFVSVNFNDAGTRSKAVYVEDKFIPRAIDYMTGDQRPRLDTTWFTAGEPSLEKKTKQIKMWGIIDGDVEINHTLDWKRSGTPVADGVYTSTDDELFSHKKRMDSSNALACSVSMQFSGNRFEIEGLELEWDPFQLGMKR